MNKLALCEISFLCAVALSYSQTIDITGTVESAGTALAGATIKLKAAGIQTTSDATGKYILASTAAQMQTPGRFSSSLTPALRADCVTFSIGAEQPVSIDLCTVSGDLVYAAISSRLFQSGSYSVPIANVALAEGAYIVRVKIGSRETALRYFALSAKSGAQFVRGVRSDNSFSKRAAFADTLLCQHSGFASESLAVTSATGTHDFSLTALQNGPGMKLISAGTFTMGSSSSFNANASPPHPVTLAAFYMDTTEVTQGTIQGRDVGKSCEFRWRPHPAYRAGNLVRRGFVLQRKKQVGRKGHGLRIHRNIGDSGKRLHRIGKPIVCFCKHRLSTPDGC